MEARIARIQLSYKIHISSCTPKLSSTLLTVSLSTLLSSPLVDSVILRLVILSMLGLRLELVIANVVLG